MRFILMHKTNEHWEAGAIPTADVIARVGKLMGELQGAGVLLDGGGLRASSQGARLRFSGGQRSVEPGPFKAGSKAPAGFAILRTASLDEAVEWASRFADVLGDTEIDVRPVTEPWDIGLGNKPEGLTTRRYMAMYKVAPAQEATAHAPETAAAMKRLHQEMSRAGVLLSAVGFEPSAKGKRLQLPRSPRAAGGKPIVTDGPFTETKELIAGFVMVAGDSIEDAMRWASSYLEVVETHEVDVLGCDERL